MTGEMSANASSAGNTLFGLWGIPFIVIGQYMIWGRFFYIAWKKGRTYYAVTNKRVLVVVEGMTRQVFDASLRKVDTMSLTLRADGIGSLEFPAEEATNPSFLGFPKKQRRGGIRMGVELSRLAFVDIEEARKVHALISAERARAQKSLTT